MIIRCTGWVPPITISFPEISGVDSNVKNLGTLDLARLAHNSLFSKKLENPDNSLIYLSIPA